MSEFIFVIFDFSLFIEFYIDVSSVGYGVVLM